MYPPSTFTVQKLTQIDDGIGGVKEQWDDHITIEGYLDMMTGTDQPNNQQGSLNNAFVEESTHVLVVPNGADVDIDDSMRVVGGGKAYDVTFVDDPVGVGHHLEVYLRYRR